MKKNVENVEKVQKTIHIARELLSVLWSNWISNGKYWNQTVIRMLWFSSTNFRGVESSNIKRIFVTNIESIHIPVLISISELCSRI